MRAPGLCAVAVLFALAGWGGAAQATEEPSGYRMDHYRGPVPGTLTGATVVNDAAAHALWQEGKTAFIDVLPRPPKPKGLPEDTIWREKPHRSIPGAIWLPNVGYGAIHTDTHAYFKAGLSEATGGDPAHPVLFFCLAECWMSWNAAKRALEYGYSHVFWYPDGTDGWTFEDWPTEKVKRFAPEGGT
ncbi:MAG: PQQ-dependent catabolism-associated CXXCW motif protein [Pseudomonadota bacterium]